MWVEVVRAIIERLVAVGAHQYRQHTLPFFDPWVKQAQPPG